MERRPTDLTRSNTRTRAHGAATTSNRTPNGITSAMTTTSRTPIVTQPKASVSRSNTSPATMVTRNDTSNRIRIVVPQNTQLNTTKVVNGRYVTAAGVTQPPTAAVKRSHTAPTSRTLAYAKGTNEPKISQAVRQPPPARSNTSPSSRPTATATNLARSKSESHRMPAPGKKLLTEKASPPFFSSGSAAKNLILSSTTDEAYIDSGLNASSGHVVRVVESGGVCLKPALRALYGRHLPPEARISWNRSTEQDHRMHVLLDWIERTRWGIASLGLHKFLLTRTKGALIFNVHGRLPESPEAPAVDWITFDDAQRTLDPQIQKYIGESDPTTHTLVFAFRLSPSEDTLKIWGKSIGVPPQLPVTYATEIKEIQKELKKRKFNVVSGDEELHRPTSPGFLKWFRRPKM